MSGFESAAWLGTAKAKTPKIKELDSSIYLGKAEAAALLKVHPRQIERRAQQGYIEKHYLPKKAGEKAARVVYSRADIEQILEHGIPEEKDLDASELALVPDDFVAGAPPKALNKHEVIEYLGKSKRTVETYIASGRLPCHYFNGPNGKTAAFNPEDVKRLKSELEIPMVRVLPVKSDSQKQTDPKSQVSEAVDLALLLSAISAGRGEQKPWLTLEEAIAYSGLTRKWLLGAVDTGAVDIRDMGKHARGGRWRFARRGLR